MWLIKFYFGLTRFNLQVMFLAGPDTSAVTLEWTLSYLLNHPELLKKARDELENQLGSKHLINQQDLSKLKYFQNIISETFRLYPAVTLLPHISSDDCSIKGYDMPHGP